MAYFTPSLKTPINPILYCWIKTVPEQFREKQELMDFLLRICHRIYDGNGFGRDSNVNPFYKIVELLQCDKLEFEHLQRIKEYYHFDIISYLIEGNRGEFYFGYPCNNENQLRSALCRGKNITTKETLTNILSNIV
ncbi:MAG: hypothetical protein K2H50_01505 [Paramuribaculum sp.]|nr:hypothetical protein [Paramuribaculum sp.]